MIVSSHILPELEDLADRYAIMRDGAWVEAAPGVTFFTRADLAGGIGATGRTLRFDGDDATLAKVTAALDASGVAYRIESRGGLNQAVLDILKGAPQ